MYTRSQGSLCPAKPRRDENRPFLQHDRKKHPFSFVAIRVRSGMEGSGEERKIAPPWDREGMFWPRWRGQGQAIKQECGHHELTALTRKRRLQMQ